MKKFAHHAKGDAYSHCPSIHIRPTGEDNHRSAIRNTYVSTGTSQKLCSACCHAINERPGGSCLSEN